MAVNLARFDDHAIRQIRAGRQSLVIHPVNVGVFPHMPTSDVRVESSSGLVQHVPGIHGHQSPWGVEGDTLAVRESWALDLDGWPPPTVEDATSFLYRADMKPGDLAKHQWLDPNDLPRRAFRLFLGVERLQIGRLHRVAQDQAVIHASGVPRSWDDWDGWPPPRLTREDFETASSEHMMEFVWHQRFREGDVWAWDNNPLVWVMRFAVLEAPPEGFHTP